jgi:3-oxoadipate enol-lactonase
MLITINGRRAHYDMAGPEGAPVVCLAHCLSGDTGVWAEQVPALIAERWRVLRLDMRGHGGSAAAPGAETMSALAQDVVDLLDRLDLQRVHFAGVSIGGMIGQVLGLEHPARVTSLMLCDTSAEAVPGGQAMWEARFAAVRKAGSLEPLADDAMGRWFTDAYRPRCPGVWRQIRETVAATTPEGYFAGAKAIIDFDVAALLPQVRTPTLVVCGDGDAATPPDGARRIAAAVPSGRYQEIADARHLPMTERPEVFNRIMLDWLRSQSK